MITCPETGKECAVTCCNGIRCALQAIQKPIKCSPVSVTVGEETIVPKSKVGELVDALSWALDLLDIYDTRLAGIDGHDAIYDPTHVAAKAKARTALREASK